MFDLLLKHSVFNIGSSRDNLVEMELTENRAVPNHYVDSSEFIRRSDENSTLYDNNDF